MSFIVRNLFIQYIGIDYLGLNGLFSNILNALNLVDLGIGTAITYHLYKPLASNDSGQILSMMQFFKKAYRLIGTVILLVGIILMLFIQHLIKDQPFNLNFLRLVFFIQLLGTASTYFLAYKRTLLYADQKNYVATLIDTVTNIIMLVVRIATLVAFKSYIIYLVLILVQGILSNMIISFACGRIYPFLKHRQKGQLVDKTKIFHNLKSIVVEKIVGFIYTSTDNIIISRFVGLASVGILSNYNLIISTVQTMFVQITNSVQASLGNLIHSENNKELVNDVFNKFNFFCFFCTSFCVTSFITLTGPFIELWIGKEFVMPDYIIILSSINYFTASMRTPLSQMISVYGMFRQTRNVSVVSATINIVISLVLVNYIGVAGVFIGRIASDIIYWIGHTYYVLINKLDLPLNRYLIKILGYTSITVLECVATFLICKWVFKTSSIFTLAGRGVLCILIPFCLNIFVYRKTIEFDYYKSLVINLFGKLQRRHN
jgi:O-antigen/teichoic acid export membrane protein